MNPMTCPVCSSESYQLIFHRKKTPVLQNAVYRSERSAREAPTGDLRILKCDHCGFAWNGSFDPKLIAYTEEYDNSQTHSEAFSLHLATRAARIIGTIPKSGSAHIVEIGCGQGDFLRSLLDLTSATDAIRATGFDPAYRGMEPHRTNLDIFPEYFTAESAARLVSEPTILLSRHTIEHVPDPIAFLKAIRATLPDDSDARLFIETPDNGWILRHNAFQDYFYEHCSLFDFGSISVALRDAGFSPQKVETCFSGQYLWVEAQASPVAVETPAPSEHFDAFLRSWKTTLKHALAKGPVALWGAGAKGATFALMMDPAGEILKVVVDSNPGKQGGYIPISAHPIVAPEQLSQYNIASVVLMNPNYEAEIRAKLSILGLSLDVIVLR